MVDNEITVEDAVAVLQCYAEQSAGLHPTLQWLQTECTIKKKDFEFWKSYFYFRLRQKNLY